MRVSGLMLDLDGTLYVGAEPVPGARAAVARLKAAGFAIRYVTNTTRKSGRAVTEGMRDLGFEVEDAEVLTPAKVAADFVGTRSYLPLVDESLLEDLPAVRPAGDRPDYVLIGDLGEGFTHARLDEAFRCLMEGAELVALQKNRYWRTGTGLSLDAGPFVAALEYASGKRATILGKPQADFFRLALKSINLEAGEVAMVGDDPESDVAGARRAGLKGIQVRTGKWSPDAGGGEADLVLDSVAGLPETLTQLEGEV